MIFTYVIVIAILYTNFFGINTLLLKELYFEDDEYYMQYHAIWCIHSKGSVRGQKWASSTGNQRSISDNRKINSFWVFLLNLNDFLIYRVYLHVKSMFFNFYKKLSIKCFAVLVLFLSCKPIKNHWWNC